MSDETSTTDYVLAREAAVRFSLSRDYVTRLAREGRIEGRRVKNSWHVSEESLRRFCAGQEDARAERHGALAATRREEYRGEVTSTTTAAEAVASMRAAVGQLAAKKPVAHSLRTAPLYAIHPTLDILHRATALVGALALVAGGYAFLYPEPLHIAGGVVREVMLGAAAAISSAHE